MEDEAEQRRARRAERAEHAAYHADAQRRRDQEESTRAQLLVERFVARALEQGLPTAELRARPYSGRGRYRTGVVGWYLRRNESIGVGTDGSYYVLLVAPVRLGRWRTVPVEPSPPPLEVGRGGRDGEAVALEDLLRKRLQWDRAAGV